jgi:hypothetical protein
MEIDLSYNKSHCLQISAAVGVLSTQMICKQILDISQFDRKSSVNLGAPEGIIFPKILQMNIGNVCFEYLNIPKW